VARGALERAPLVVAAGALAVLVAQGTGRFILTPLLPSMQAELGLDDTEAGLLGSLNFAGYLAGAVLVTVVPRLGVDRLIPAGLALVSLGALAMPLLPSWPVWLVARLVAGVGGAFLFLGGVAATAGRLARIGRPQAMGGVLAGVGVGIALGGLIALLTRPSWRAGWLAMAAIGLLGAPILVALAKGGAGQGTTASRLRPGPALLRLAWAYGLAGFGFGAGATFFVRVLAERDADLAVLAWILAGLVGAPSAPVWVAAGRRIGRIRALVGAILLLALGTALCGLAAAPLAALPAGLLLGGTFMGITALALEEAQATTPEARAPAAAFVTGTFGIGQVLGPLLSGVLLDTLGPFPALLAPAALAAAGMLFLLPDLRRAG
jgi:MFS family permease